MKRQLLQRGMTAVEAQLACVVLSLLLTLLFWIMNSCANIFARADLAFDLTTEAQQGLSRIQRESERASYQSVSLSSGPEGISFLSPVQLDDLTMQTQGPGAPTRLTWTHYVLYRFNTQEEMLETAVLEVDPGAPEATQPGPIQQFSGEFGIQNLTYYLTNALVWSPVARQVTFCTFDYSLAERILLVELTVTGRRRFRSEPESFSIRGSVQLRN